MIHNDARHEARVRQIAKRRGYIVRKSRARNLHSNNLGEYMLVDSDINSIVLGSRFDATLDDIQAFFKPKTNAA